MNVYALIVPYLRPYRMRFAQACVAMLGVAVFNGASFYLLKPIVDQVFVSRDFTMLWLAIVAVPSLIALKTIFSYVQNYLMSWIGQRVVQQVREDLFRHLHALPLDFFAEHESSEILSRVTNDLNTLQSTLNSVPLYLIRDSLTLLVLLGVLFWLDWRFAMLALLSVPFVSLVLIVLGRKMRDASLRSQAIMSQIYRRFQESLQGMTTLKAYNYEEGATLRFREENLLFFNQMMRYLRATALATPLTEFAGAMVVALLIYYGGTEIIDGKMTPGAFFAFMGSFFAAYAPAKNLARLNSELQRALASGERIFQLLGEPPYTPRSTAGRPWGALASSIELRGVSFSYPGSPRPALKDVHWTLRRGERVAIVGPSGSGKSTLAHLLLRFQEPSRGSILFDGVVLAELDVRSVRERIALLPREIPLFNDTVWQNLTLGRLTSTVSEVEAACRAAYAADFIEALPQGYQTRLGERGVKLTAGQRQRLALARAWIRDPSLVIFDGGASSLDGGDGETHKALMGLMERRTVLILANESAHLPAVDRLYVLDRGELLEEPSRA